jgi:polyisoprenoid-binding protein YceI
MIKKTLLIPVVISSIALLSFTAKTILHVDTYRIDSQTSKVEWFAEKVTGKHNGTINISSGDIYNNHGKLGGKITIDMNSIVVDDLTGDYKGKLEKHLKSEDFFAVKTYPTSVFEITSVVPLSSVTAGEPNFNITGNLTIKNVTNEITFPAYIRFEGSSMSATGQVTVDRSKFDVKYGSKTFFSDIGDKAIYDEFKLKLTIKASM